MIISINEKWQIQKYLFFILGNLSKLNGHIIRVRVRLYIERHYCFFISIFFGIFYFDFIIKKYALIKKYFYIIEYIAYSFK